MAVPTTNERLLDRLIRHAVLVQRHSLEQVLASLRIMNGDVFPEIELLVLALATKLKSRGPRALATQQYRDFVTALAALTLRGTQKWHAAVRRSLQEFAVSESEWAIRHLRLSIDPQVFERRELRRPGRNVARALVTSRPFNGRFLREEAAELERDTRARVMARVRNGLLRGRGTDDIIRSIVGTRRRQFSDGVLNTSRNQASRIVRTAVTHVHNAAREAVYEENSDLITRVRWVATLDNLTCVICGGLDGKVFPVGKGERPPAHPHCRCTTVPVVPSFRILGLKDPPPATRASLDGEVPADLTFGRWLRLQPAAVQNEVLGIEKARLFRRGKVPIDRFTDKNLRPLTIRELEALEIRLEAG